jgi:error-prone DNA polymerase
MICAADTVGVFQIESRAQMSMLPRLQTPLLLRPGDRGRHRAPRPHPGRHGAPLPAPPPGAGAGGRYPQEALREALERTLGVPIFQEQVMQIAMLAAGFSAGEADSLRRSMAAWKRKGGVHKFHDRIVGGMVERGYTEHSRKASSARSKASANTASPKATPPALRCWCG